MKRCRDRRGAAQNVVAIDGCNSHCEKKTLERAGVVPTIYVVVTDLGVKMNISSGSVPAGPPRSITLADVDVVGGLLWPKDYLKVHI